jgi:hypothetical protein
MPVFTNLCFTIILFVCFLITFWVSFGIALMKVLFEVQFPSYVGVRLGLQPYLFMKQMGNESIDLGG